MKLNSLLIQLEGIRLKCEDPNYEMTSGLAATEIIHTFVEYFDNEKIRQKIDEITF